MTSGPARDVIGYTVAFESGDPVLAAVLDRAYVGFPTVDHAEHRFAVGPESHPPEDRPAGVELTVDGEPRSWADNPGGLLASFVGTLNRTAAEHSPHLLVHAGAVQRNGVGVVLPAPMESGKTTLTAGLVRAGFGYLTDEAAAFDRHTATLLPYPKPLSLDRGSWPLFPELEPHEPFPDDAYKAHQWQVPAVDIRPDALGTPCPARVVVFPTYTAGAPTRLEPLTRAEALVEIAKNTFRFDREGRPTFSLLAEILRGAETYRLTVGDLDEAVTAISRLVAG